MTTGTKLKNQLGLSKLHEVRILRVIGLPFRIFIVYYNSQLDTLAITPSLISKSYNYFNLAKMETRGLDDDLTHTPLMDISDFNGDLHNSLICSVDLIGLRFQDKHDFVYESCYYTNLSKIEELTINDFRKAGDDLVSDFTKEKIVKRKELIKSKTITNTKLIETEVKGNTPLFKFLVEATPNGEPKQQVDILTKQLTPNKSKLYELWLEFPDALELLDLQDKETVDRTDIVALLDSADVKFASSSPSYLMQGMSYWLSQLSSSIVPENRKPKRWDKQHGEKGFFDKHLYELLVNLPFYTQQMASQLQSELIKQGRLLPSKKRTKN